MTHLSPNIGERRSKCLSTPFKLSFSSVKWVQLTETKLAPCQIDSEQAWPLFKLTETKLAPCQIDSEQAWPLSN